MRFRYSRAGIVTRIIFVVETATEEAEPEAVGDGVPGAARRAGCGVWGVGRGTAPILGPHPPLERR